MEIYTRRSIARGLILVFWCAIIGIFLFAPRGISWLMGRDERPFITLFIWGDIFDLSIVEQFEQETGIRVYCNFYSTNEEMLAKMQLTGGKGYDLIVPSDYAVTLLRRDKLLKKIDTSKLTFYSYLNKKLLALPFDPKNEYTIPWACEVYGLGVDVPYFAQKREFRGMSEEQIKAQFAKQGLGAMFDLKKRDYTVVMTADPLELFSFADLYLKNRNIPRTSGNTQLVELLLRQKKWVEAYTSLRSDYLLTTGNSPLALASTAQLGRGVVENKGIAFVVPQEGTFTTVENCALPAQTHKDELVYRFLNFVFSEKSVLQHFKKYCFLPARNDELKHADLEQPYRELLQIGQSQLNSLRFFRPMFPDSEKYRLWVWFKSRA